MMKKGNIVLFYPSYENIGQYSWFPFPYLYIGPFLEKAGFEVSIIDARVESDWRNALRVSLKDALCLGITSMTGPDIRDAIEASMISKEVNPELSVVWGGPHATVQSVQTANLDSVDLVVKGQGEQVMVDIANKIYEGRDLMETPAIVYKKNGRLCQNGMLKPVSFDYDIFPGFHLVDIEKYRSPNNVVSIFTVRGCPFSCTFCTTSKQGYSERTLEQVKKEILFVVNDLKFKNIFIQDGTYFIKKERVMEIAGWIIESGLDIKWKAKARVNSLLNYSEKDLSILKESGLVSLFFGIESGSERVLRNMRKNTGPKDAEKSAEICRRNQIEFYASFLFATPGETIDDLKITIAHIKRLKEINKDIIIQNCIYLPLPGTLMYEQACECGYSPPEDIGIWTKRDVSTRFDKRDDITWIPAHVLDEYIKIYNDEFRDEKHLYIREKEGTYTSVFRRKSA